MRTIFLILTPLIVLAIALTGTHILVERLFILIVIAIILSYIFARFGLRQLKGELKNPGRHYFPGQLIFIEAVTSNDSPFPKSFLRFRIKTDQPDKNGNSLINIPSKGSFPWSVSISYPRRGNYKLGPLVAEATDPFGLFRLHRILDKEKDIIICPATVELPFFQADPGPLRNKFIISEASAFSAVRDYVPGDSFNRIHWPSTAHTGKLIVKEFDVDQSEKVWVILDLNKDSKFGTGVETTEEYSITIAASIVKKYADSGRQVGLIAQNESYHYFSPGGRNMNMWRMLEALAVFKANGRIPLSRTLYRAREQLAGNAAAVIITSSDKGDVADSIISINKHGIKVVVVLLDAESFGGGTSSKKTEIKLNALNIPTYIIKQGCNLTETLNSHHKNVSGKSGIKAHEIAS